MTVLYVFLLKIELNSNASVKFIEKSSSFSGSSSRSLSHSRTIRMGLRYRTLFTVQEGQSMPLDIQFVQCQIEFRAEW